MQIIGHQRILDILSRAKASGRLAHGLCFVGPEHVGKRTVALKLAEEFLRVENVERHADCFLVSRERDEKTEALKQEISIEQIRTLREQLSQTSFFSGPKIAIIEEAELMSGSAANALLKTLEEPPGKTTIILIATSLKDLPATIVSRVQVLRFGTVSETEMIAGGIEEKFARMAFGRPGIALSFRDSEVYDQAMKEMADFKELINAPVWRRAKIIESWFGKKKAHSEGQLELILRARLWKIMLRDGMLKYEGASELVGTGIMGDNSVCRTQDALKFLLKLERALELIAANGNARYALEACFLTE
ncbi:MAG: AAA family ATPase [bacterium]